MNSKKFRFGVTVGMLPDSKAWLATAKRIEDRGYSSMLMADGLWLPSASPVLSAVATATTALRVGTHVLAAPFRAPAAVAQETDTLDMITDQRFELGLGTGMPEGGAADAEQLGVPFGTGAERRARLADTIAAVKQRFAAQDRPAPKILLGGSGPKLAELAVAEADILTLSVSYGGSEADLAAKLEELRTVTGGALDRLELAINLLIIGDRELPAWVPPKFRELPAHSFGRLGGTPAQMADTLRRRRDELGISYVTTPQWSIDEFAPVVELLAGT